MMSSNSRVSEIIRNVQLQLQKKGLNSFSRLRRAFLVADRDGSGALNRREFEDLLEELGIFLAKVDTQRLVKAFDANKDGNVTYEELLAGVIPPLEPRRARMVEKVFQAMDYQGRNFVTLDEIFTYYHPERHPWVLTGQKKEEEIYNKFVDNFNGFEAPRDTQLTLEDFMDSYKGISICTLDSEDQFIREMETCWGIKEDAGIGSFQRSIEIDQLEDRLRDKLFLKARSGQQDHASLAKAFKFIDVDESNTISKPEFRDAIERIGCHLSDDEVNALFFRYDKDQSGFIDYQEFTDAFKFNRKKFPMKSFSQTQF